MKKIRYENYANGEIINIYSDRGDIRLENFDGGTCESEAITYRPIDFDGDIFISSTLKPRTITATVKIIGISGGRYNRKAAMRGYNNLLRAFTVGDNGKLTYYNNGDEYEIECRLASVPPYEDVNQFVLSVDIVLIADKPVWYDTIENRVDITTSEVKHIWVDSAIPVPFKLYVKGLNAEPWLLSATAKAHLCVFRGLENAQQHFLIDTDKCTCMLYDNDDDDTGELANQYLDEETEFFYLMPGDNMIFFANWTKDFTVYLTYRDGYLGV